jgi:hypothetical protein
MPGPLILESGEGVGPRREYSDRLSLNQEIDIFRPMYLPPCLFDCSPCLLGR